jgi:hypothetical protein
MESSPPLYACAIADTNRMIESKDQASFLPAGQAYGGVSKMSKLVGVM